MLLAVDIGNTNIKFGIFDGDVLLSRSSIPTETASSVETIRSAVGKGLDLPIEQAILCSVVPEADVVVAAYLRDVSGAEPLFVTNDLNFGLKTAYEPLHSLGTDRIVNCFAAAEKYGPPVIVCSLGTASTFDAVDASRTFLGGVIAPGMKPMATGLHSGTANLPEVDVQKPNAVLGNTTIASIESGIFYGHLSLVQGMIARIKNEVGDSIRVIATGGSAKLTAENTSAIDIVDEDLLLDGLRILNERLR
jgi:type III pantothenate kinase